MIKVNKQVAKRLDYMLNDDKYSTESILEQHVKGWNEEKNKCLNELKLSELAECLFIGYDVVKTVEDEILEEYNNVSNLVCLDNHIYGIGYKKGYLDATEILLNKYNIKIEGINA